MKASVLGLLIAAGAFGASTIYLAVQLKEERDQADQVAEQTRALNARIAELERIQAELGSPRLASIAPATAGAPVSGEKPAVVTETTSDARDPKSESADRGRFSGPPERSEAMQKMMRAQIRATFKRVHADIAAKLGLGADEASKLVDLLVDQQLANMDGRRQGRDSTPQQRAADVQAQQEKNLAEVSALIGADKMEAYKAYQDTMPARQEVEMLSRQLEGNDASALSKDQRDRLVTALAEERKRVPQPKGADFASREEYMKANAEWQDDYNQRTATRAGSILNSDQQTAYTEYQQWTKEMRTQFEARRAARDAGGPGGPPGMAPGPPR